MRRFVAIFCVALLLLTCSCSDNTVNSKGEKVVPVEDVETLAAAVSVDVTVPSTAKYVTCSIVNDFIGEIEFSYNSIIFVYRASKLISGEDLHGFKDLTSNGTVEIGDRAEIEMFTAEDGSRVATWYIKGTSYSVSSVKSVSDDFITELCDLIIK